MALPGRDNEAAKFEQCLDAAVSGRPQFLRLHGPAGIGKTALIDLLEVHATLRQVPIARTRMSGPGHVEGYRPVTELVAGLLADVEEPRAGLLGWVRKRISRSGLEVVGEVMSLVPGVDVATAAYKVALLFRDSPDDDGEARIAKYAHNRAGFLADVLARRARDPLKPLVLFLDDMQWSDAGTLEVVSLLLHRAVQSPPLYLLLGCAIRPAGEENATVERLDATVKRYLAGSGRGDVLDLAVGPLPDSDLPQAIERLLGVPVEMSAPTAMWLSNRCGGNPLELRGVLACLVAKGQLIDVGGVLRLRASVAAGESVPAEVAQLVDATLRNDSSTVTELAVLPSPLRRLLEAASVWGGPFAVGPTAQMAALRGCESIDSSL